jgi:hypothetical protein
MTVYQYGSFEPTLDPSYISLDNTFKQTVPQRFFSAFCGWLRLVRLDLYKDLVCKYFFFKDIFDLMFSYYFQRGQCVKQVD